LADLAPEEITGADDLYRRLVPDGHIRHGQVLFSAFLKRREPGEKHGQPDPALSVNLARLSSPEATLAQAPRPGFGVAVFSAGIPIEMGLTVRHAPEAVNPAHTLVEGLSSLEECQRLANACTILIPPNPVGRKGS
jgi:hypothetical protein